MERFSRKPKRQWMLPASAGFFLLLFLLFSLAVSGLEQDSLSRQKTELETALQRGTVICYALLGRYPEDLGELEQYCPLYYNREHFCVDYNSLGANLLPDITVLERGD